MMKTTKNNLSSQIRLAGIAQQSLVNGKGMRKVFFSQGCTHYCPACFNKETWSFEGGQMFEMDELINQLKKETYLDGVTFSGGEPFQQQNKFAYMATEIKKIPMNIWCYTGYTFDQLLELSKKDSNIKTMLENIDVIVDGKFDENLQDPKIKFRGSKNQRIIDVQKSLKNNKIEILDFDNN